MHLPSPPLLFFPWLWSLLQVCLLPPSCLFFWNLRIVFSSPRMPEYYTPFLRLPSCRPILNQSVVTCVPLWYFFHDCKNGHIFSGSIASYREAGALNREEPAMLPDDSALGQPDELLVLASLCLKSFMKNSYKGQIRSCV